jgi:hypothetical protein
MRIILVEHGLENTLFDAGTRSHCGTLRARMPITLGTKARATRNE